MTANHDTSIANVAEWNEIGYCGYEHWITGIFNRFFLNEMANYIHITKQRKKYNNIIRYKQCMEYFGIYSSIKLSGKIYQKLS